MKVANCPQCGKKLKVTHDTVWSSVTEYMCPTMWCDVTIVTLVRRP